MRYNVYNLLVEMQLPHMVADGASNNCYLSDTPDVTVSVNPTSQQQTEISPSSFIAVKGNDVLSRNTDIGFVRISEGRSIEIEPQPSCTQDMIQEYVWRNPIAIILMQRGNLVLHGSAVSYQDKGVVFVGDSGAGKSTLSALLHSKGCPYIADDILPVDINGNASMGNGLFRLNTETAKKLNLSGTPVPTQLSYEKHKLNIKYQNKFWETANQNKLPVSTIFVLSKPSEQVTAYKFTRLPLLEAVKAIYQNRFQAKFEQLEKMWPDSFQIATTLARQSKVILVERPIGKFDPEVVFALLLEALKED